MKNPKQQEVPKTIIKGSGVINTDLNHPKGNGTLLFVSPKCIVVGLHNLPYKLFTTPEFSEISLPANIKKDIFEVEELVLQATFSIEAGKSIKYCTIPKWVTNFKKIEYLRFEYVELDNLDYFRDLPIQHLNFENIKYKDIKKVIAAIKQFKHLKEISYDQSLSTDIIYSIKELNLKLTVINEATNRGNTSH